MIGFFPLHAPHSAPVDVVSPNCTATSPAVLHHRLHDHFHHTSVHQHHWFIGATTRPQPSLIQEGSGLRSMKPSTLRGESVLPRSVHFARSFSVLTTPERSSLSPHCLFRAACSLKTSCPSDFLSSASDTCAHTHVCTSSCRTSADHVLLIFELLYYEDQFTADRDDYLPCPVSMPSRRRYSH